MKYIVKKFSANKKELRFCLFDDEKIIRSSRDYMSLIRFLNEERIEDEFGLDLINYAG